MSSVAGTDATGGQRESEVGAQLEELADLFRRRLLDDRDKRRAFNALYERLEAAEEAARGEQIVPLARELILLIDRIDQQDDGASTLPASVRDELIEALRRHQIVELEVQGLYDPVHHEIVGVVPTVEGERDGAVRDVIKRGFALPHRVLRPAQVIVARDDPTASATGWDDEPR